MSPFLRGMSENIPSVSRSVGQSVSRSVGHLPLHFAVSDWSDSMLLLQLVIDSE
jgi:hypothetical protein